MPVYTPGQVCFTENLGSYAVALESFCLSPGFLQSTTQQEALLQQVSRQGVVPITSPHGYLEGILTEFSLLLPQQLDSTSTSFSTSVNFPLLLQEAKRMQVSLRLGQTLQDAQALLYRLQCPFLPVVDDDGRYTGVAIHTRRILEKMTTQPKPPHIGGMATPFGVYLTSGKLAAGPGWWKMIATGFLFGAYIILLDFLYNLFTRYVFNPMTTTYTLPAPWLPAVALSIEFTFLVVALLAGIRYSSLAGVHAAEHMTVNAIEAGLPLETSAVKTQSRIHKRCGTNLAASLFVLQFLITMMELLRSYSALWLDILILFGAGFTLWKYHQPMGQWFQKHWTTKPPTEKQLASGILAGKAIMQQYAQFPHPPAAWYQRLFFSGLPYILIGFVLAVGFAQLGFPVLTSVIK